MKILISILAFLIFDKFVEAQTQNGPGNIEPTFYFKPSIGVVIAVLCIMFMLTFLLVIYARFCHSRSSSNNRDTVNQNLLPGSRSSRFSGIDKTVIESLPFFKFSSLKGKKQGLECSVCLSKFEEIEVLRLLPKCKHAFHIDCIDKWLEKHSSCPLCRRKVSMEDPSSFAYSNSWRFLNVRENSDIEIFVEREVEEEEEETRKGSSSSSSFSFRKITEKGIRIRNEEKEEATLIGFDDKDNQHDDLLLLHKFNHKIVVSDVVLQNRWSNVTSSDIMFLNSEMLNSISSARFSDKGETSSQNQQNMGIVTNDMSGSKSVFRGRTSNFRKIDPMMERRSMSEIAGVSRFEDLNIMKTNKISCLSETNVDEERRRQVWLPIAGRTVQWFVNREKRFQHSYHTSHQLDV